MNKPKIDQEWSKYLKFFSEQNIGRRTRLGVFERDGDVVSDYWLESGEAFAGVDIDTSGSRRAIQILVGEMEHAVVDPQVCKFILTCSGEEDGLDITDLEGRTTVLRFEIASNE
jgi:hypothetical protein